MSKDIIKLFEFRYSPDFRVHGLTLETLKHYLFTKSHTKSQSLDVRDITGHQVKVTYPFSTKEL